MRLPHASDLRAFLAAAAVAHLSSTPASRASHRAPPPPPQQLRFRAFASSRASSRPSPTGAVASAGAAAACEQGAAKPAICTADELHYAPVPGTEWRIALWRYRPPPEVMAASGSGGSVVGGGASLELFGC